MLNTNLIQEMNELPELRKIGFIGTGIMGAAMAAHLMEAGFEVSVYNRTKEKAEELLRRGAAWCDSPAACAEGKDAVITIVGYPKDVEEVYFGEKGILEHARKGAYLIDMTTSSPELAVRIHEAAAERGLHALDAPVTGGDTGAKAGTLTILCGGEEKDFYAVRPLFEAMGSTIAYTGKAGNGQHTKMCNQIVIAGTMAGVSEALVYAAWCGLDLERMVQTIRPGAAGCWTLDNLAPRVIRGDWAPGFMVDHFIKDMGIALEEAERMRLSMPTLALVKQLYAAIQAQGMGCDGTQALVRALESLAGCRLFK